MSEENKQTQKKNQEEEEKADIKPAKPEASKEKEKSATKAKVTKKSSDTKKPSKKEKEEKKKHDDRDIVRAGQVVHVHESIIDTTPKGEERKRIQVFKGMVLARKHGKEPGASITVRKVSDKVGVEKIFPLYSPLIDRVVIDKKFKTRRAKLYFLRDSKKRLQEVK